MANTSERAYVIEVIGGDGVVWTAMAQERERIKVELAAAPPAVVITIYEWVKSYVNKGDGFPGRPTWDFISQYPWTTDLL